MSSILTNTSAMVALQTMRGINSNLANTQNQISTGMKVGSAKDNAAVWAISRTMESDVKGFRGIQESLSLGESTVAVARNASETVTDLLTDMKGMIVAAQEENVDREKIQTDIEQLRQQINSVVGSAQFNGLNLVNGSSDDEVSVLASLDRNAEGLVLPNHIGVDAQNLMSNASIVDEDGDYTAGTTGDGTEVALANTDPASITIGTPVAGVAYSLRLESSAGITNLDDAGGSDDFADIAFVAGAGDTAEDVAAGLAEAFAAWAADNDVGDLTLSADGADLSFQWNEAIAVGESVTVAVDTVTGEGNQAAGGLFAMNGIDVSTQEGAQAALESIEDLIDTSISAASAFGSAQSRIEIQSNFVSNLIDSLNTGIGTLVDADLEEQSARLQALQVQQQLATQSLSIANQQPQNILALFR